MALNLLFCFCFYRFNNLKGSPLCFLVSDSFAVIDEYFNFILPKFYDAIDLMLIILMIHQHQVRKQFFLPNFCLLDRRECLMLPIEFASSLTVFDINSFFLQIFKSRQRIPCLNLYLDKVYFPFFPTGDYFLYPWCPYS